VREGVISYGVSSYGYDIRVADEFRIFTNVNSTIVDPKKFDARSLVEYKGEVCIVPPNSFALARSIEYFRIPRNVLTICVGKSTYARCGIIVNVTPFEPEWEGFVTLEISNTTPLPAKIYANEGRIVNMSREELEQGLQRELCAIRQMLNVDRVSWFQQSKDETKYVRVHTSSSEYALLTPEESGTTEISRIVESVLRAAPIQVRYTKDLVQQGLAEEALLERNGIKSIA